MSTPIELLYENMAQWLAISQRESAKYQRAYELFNELKREYLTNDEFTRPGQDRNHAWFADTRTQDSITAMKDAWQCLQSATARIQALEIQIKYADKITDATNRLRIKAARASLNR